MDGWTDRRMVGEYHRIIGSSRRRTVYETYRRLHQDSIVVCIFGPHSTMQWCHTLTGMLAEGRAIMDIQIVI